MITRRAFVKSLPWLAAALSSGANRAIASDDASKVCLIVGNGAYPRMQLRNPVNDAQAMSDLFKAAGFQVDTQTDTTQRAFTEAIEHFGEAVRRASTKIAVFYYAGHGAQLEWRNYLLPVDAHVSTADELKSRCVDLGFVLSKFANTNDKTHIVILDACRNDPFGGSYRPAQSGLSQFDAPVGSLLAYSTAPGNVAFDGDGKNGLYTENLIRELSHHDARVEDALKRVRLNVRLASQGKQVPWESTSLESDVYLFDEGRKPLSDAEVEESVKADLANWMRIKSSHDAQDWIAYLRAFPNGRFAEIAQVRLSQLLEVHEAPPAVLASAPAVSPAAPPQPPASAAVAVAPVVPAAKAPEVPAINVAQDAVAPHVVKPSDNPFSAGRYPLGRAFTVGDEATFLWTDLLTGVQKWRYGIQITSVDLDADRIEGNDGQWVFDSMGNELVTPVGGTNDVPAQTVPAELQVGKKWTAAWTAQHPEYGKQFITLDLSIVAREITRVVDVDIDAFRVEGRGVLTSTGTRGEMMVVTLERRFWIVPGFDFAVKTEYVNRYGGKTVRADRSELMTLSQQTTSLPRAAAGYTNPG
jgi:hypothetical protein